MEFLKKGLNKNEEWKINKKYYRKVADYMLPKPTKKVSVLVTGWGEWLQIISIDGEI